MLPITVLSSELLRAPENRAARANSKLGLALCRTGGPEPIPSSGQPSANRGTTWSGLLVPTMDVRESRPLHAGGDSKLAGPSQLQARVGPLQTVAPRGAAFRSRPRMSRARERPLRAAGLESENRAARANSKLRLALSKPWPGCTLSLLLYSPSNTNELTDQLDARIVHIFT